MRQPFSHLYRVGRAGVLTVIGLVSALLGDGVWDAVSALALALGAVAAVGGWYGLRRPKARQTRPVPPA
ncbi:hypothetical protein [Massilia sp.]|uniref:hypothetical protein n=1 Tax=Massilia sp. TaxID=1882437 RepID=UPI00289F38DA|nr:hypothetical protein [Massilia sp.]